MLLIQHVCGSIIDSIFLNILSGEVNEEEEEGAEEVQEEQGGIL